jgi:hypothetical protein
LFPRWTELQSLKARHDSPLDLLTICRKGRGDPSKSGRQTTKQTSSSQKRAVDPERGKDATQTNVIESKTARALAGALLSIRAQVQMRTDDAENDFATERINHGYGIVLWHRWCGERQPRSTGHDEWRAFCYVGIKRRFTP